MSDQHFDDGMDDVFDEVANLLNENAGNSGFLVRICRELRRLNTDHMKMEAIFALQRVAAAHNNGGANGNPVVIDVHVGDKRVTGRRSSIDAVGRRFDAWCFFFGFFFVVVVVVVVVVTSGAWRPLSFAFN